MGTIDEGSESDEDVHEVDDRVDEGLESDDGLGTGVIDDDDGK